MLFLVVEHFAGGDPEPVYRRFGEQGRLAPAGLEYLGSWVTTDLTRCYQAMECAHRSMLDEWMANWSDIVSFEIHEVLTSPEAAERVAREDRPQRGSQTA